MPKLKTHSGAAKRFKKTGTGKIKRGHAFKRHILTSKGTKRKRQLDTDVMLDKADSDCPRSQAHDPLLAAWCGTRHRATCPAMTVNSV